MGGVDNIDSDNYFSVRKYCIIHLHRTIAFWVWKITTISAIILNNRLPVVHGHYYVHTIYAAVNQERWMHIRRYGKLTIGNIFNVIILKCCVIIVYTCDSFSFYNLRNSKHSYLKENIKQKNIFLNFVFWNKISINWWLYSSILIFFFVIDLLLFVTLMKLYY